eukprot:9360175-Ditylum_brightwellii.AAC.1
MRPSLSSTALLLLCGGEGDERFDEFNVTMVVVLEKKKRRQRECLAIKKTTESNIQVKLADKEEQVMEFVESIGFKHFILGKERVFTAMNGLKIYLEQSGSHSIQNTFYNG